MFERFTDRARRVVVLAQEAARQFDHSYIGTEHLLIGLIHEGEGIAAKALADLGVSLGVVHDQVVEIIGNGDVIPPPNIPFTPRTKKVLELSLREALQLGHNYIGTEHLLLALAREGQGVAVQILTKLGAEPETVRKRVIEKLLAGGKPLALRYMRSPGNDPAYVDAALPGVATLVDQGWTLVERVVGPVLCPDCGVAHTCNRYVEVEVAS